MDHKNLFYVPLKRMIFYIVSLYLGGDDIEYFVGPGDL